MRSKPLPSRTRQALAWTILAASLAAGCGAGEPRLEDTAEEDTTGSGAAATAPPTAAGDSVAGSESGTPDAESGWSPVAWLHEQSAELSLAVGPDGGVHALWTAQGTEGTTALHVLAPPSGAARIDTLARSWSSLEAPLLLPFGSGVLALFVGDSSGTGSPERIHAAELAPTETSSWLGVVTAASGRTGRLAGAIDAEGSPVLAWAADGEARLAFGLTPRRPPTPVPGCCSAAVELAVDADGELALLGIGTGDGGPSLRTMTVLPADDALFRVPGSTFAASDPAGRRFAITGLRGVPGVYVAYCAGAERCEGVDVWLHGAADGEPPVRVGEASDSALVAVAPGPDGRLWVAWTSGGTVHVVRARPDGAEVTHGPRIDLDLPASAGTPFALKGAARDGPLRLLLATRTDAGLRLWTHQVHPALSVTPPALPPPLDQNAVLHLMVEEGGEPIAGAVVRVLGQEVRTDVRGVAELPLAAGVRTDTLEVDVAAAGYAPLHVVFHGERPEGEQR